MDRLDLAQLYGKRRMQRWLHGGTQSSFATWVTVGRLQDGRWFAERVGYGADSDDKQRGACVFSADDRGEVLARRMAQRWTDGEGWREQPAAFDSSGRPVSERSWTKRGGEWFPGPDSSQSG